VQEASHLCRYLFGARTTDQLVVVMAWPAGIWQARMRQKQPDRHGDTATQRQAGIDAPETCSPLIGLAAICKSLSLHRSKIKPLPQRAGPPAKTYRAAPTWCRIKANGNTNQKAHGNSPTTGVLMIAHHLFLSMNSATGLVLEQRLPP
jgi:hypothetical protein